MIRKIKTSGNPKITGDHTHNPKIADIINLSQFKSLLVHKKPPKKYLGMEARHSSEESYRGLKLLLTVLENL